MLEIRSNQKFGQILRLSMELAAINCIIDRVPFYSLVVRASASGAVDRGFAPRSRHTKGVKNGTSSSLADARIKG